MHGATVKIVKLYFLLKSTYKLK